MTAHGRLSLLYRILDLLSFIVNHELESFPLSDLELGVDIKPATYSSSTDVNSSIIRIIY